MFPTTHSTSKVPYSPSFSSSSASDKTAKKIAELIDEKDPISDDDFSLLTADEFDGSTPLTKVVGSGSHAKVQGLILKNEDINEIDLDQWTPLTLAVERGDIKMIQLLIDNKANVDHPNGNGLTPLNIAVRNGDEQLAAFLIKGCGANPNALNGKKKSNFTVAFEHHQLKMVDLLAGFGFDFDIPDGSGQLPLSMCHWSNRTDWGLHLINDLKVDKELNDEVIRRVMLAHAWNIGGKTQFTNKAGKKFTIPLEGLPDLGGVQMLRQFLPSFLARNPHFTAAEKRCLLEAVTPASNMTYPSMIAHLQSGKPLLIFGGSNVEEHSVVFGLWESHFFSCNRGFGSTKTEEIKIYEINRKIISPLLLEELSKPYESINELNAMIKKIGAVLQGDLGLPSQTVGNCVWANAEASIAALFFIMKKDFPLFAAFGKHVMKRSMIDYVHDSPCPDLDLFAQVVRRWSP